MAIIIACMVGTGVFTSLGYQVMGLESVSAILMLWVAGGIMALCGALCYAELALRHPGSGGEYHYLSRIYHPAFGFLSGWVSATVGFAAPIGLAGMAFGAYFHQFLPSFSPTFLACALILTVTGLNLLGLKVSGGFQKFATYLNIGLMLGFVLVGLTQADSSHFQFSLAEADWAAVFSAPFAVSLVYVSYAYSGWNAIAYIAGDVARPTWTLPRALFGASALVMLVYVLVNLTFLYSTPIAEIRALQNPEEVAALAAGHIFGDIGAKVVAAMICLALLASVHSMTLTGPKVSEALGRDLRALRFLARTNAQGAPVVATLWQTAIALILVLTASFGQVLTFIGFTLALFTTFTVLGLVVERWRGGALPQGSYRTPLYPLPALIFLALEAWMLIYNLKDKPKESLGGLALVGLGLLVYFFVQSSRQPERDF